MTATADRAQSLTDTNAFRREQDRLGRCWTLLGILPDVASDGDWFRAELGGRSVFVQNFSGDLRAFENRCSHRFFPLRTAGHGNGPVVCGFHHWRYDEEGCAVGIPKCREMFGRTPRELGMRLNPVEIAACGSLLFGRFPMPGATSLKDWLGEAFPILESICAMSRRPRRTDVEVGANWKLCVEITLDDYHIVAVHSRPYYHATEELRYFRFGPHSAHFVGSADTLSSMAAECGAGRYRPAGYRIFNIFPNLAVSLFKAAPYWYFYLQQFVPVEPGRSRVRGWFAPTALAADGENSVFHRALRYWPLTEPINAAIVRHYIRKTAEEDHRACAQLQSVAHQVNRRPIFGAQEERVGWFEEACADALR